MYYAYILQSVNAPKETYRGHTKDLKQRLSEHNAGRSRSDIDFETRETQCHRAIHKLIAQRISVHVRNQLGNGLAGEADRRHHRLDAAQTLRREEDARNFRFARGKSLAAGQCEFDS
ncbi:MAG TPA: GIY-YIG nuclease family protein [Candidatus Angelobacter sp.]|nr:GIY-YIG nuclease family protein [Candidatus Angelobacter sp.]